MYTPDPLDTLRDMCQLFHVRLHLFKAPYDNAAALDFHLREALYKDYDYCALLENIRSDLQPGLTRTHKDIFENFYVAFSLQTDEGPAPFEFAVLGPFRYQTLSEAQICKIMSRHKLPLAHLSDITAFLGRVPLITDRRLWVNAEIYFISRLICRDGQLDYRTLNDFQYLLPELGAVPADAPDGSGYQLEMLSGGYQQEKELLDAVQKGNSDQASRLAFKYVNFQVSYHGRFGLPPYYAVLELNALLRRAAIETGVHVLRLDETFVKYAHMVRDWGETDYNRIPVTEMVADYCKLVKRYSRQSISPLVRKCLDELDFHFREDISLHTLAEKLHVSDGHLSTTFRREVGVPLTEYLNQNRVRYGQTLLESTELSIQEISTQSGFSDASYFTRLFKKYVGKAPKQYRAGQQLL